jgi:oligopeptide transport system substrate-binding protein
MLRATVLGLILLASALSLSGCGGKRDSGESQGFVVSLGIGEPKFLVPSSATESNASDVLNALFTKLVDYDEQFRPVELAAESITSADNKVWTVKLKAGWTFHNGEPVTADSYINAWNAGAWGPNAHDGNYFFAKIAGYDAMNPRDAKLAPSARKLVGLVKKDDLTFEVTLSEPYVNFKSMLGYTAFFPLPLAAFKSVDNNEIDPAYQEAPIGQGPFRMKGQWQHDQIIETVAYENYSGAQKPKVAGVTFKIYQQLTTQYQDLLAGQLDIISPQMPLEDMANAKADLGDRFKLSAASTIQILAFPTYDKRFAKVGIRRAISMAIDRDEIIRTIFRESQVSLRSFVAPLVPGYRENTCGEACQFNPKKARELFEAEGGTAAVGGRVEIAYNVDGGHKPWVDAACNQLRTNLGVECIGNPQPKFSEMLTKAKKKEPMGMFRMGWIFDYPTMESYLGPLYSTHGSSNYYGYSNPEFDRLLVEGDHAPTPEAAILLYQKAEDLLARDLPVIPLRYARNSFGHSARVANVGIDAFAHVKLLELTPSTH